MRHLKARITMIWTYCFVAKHLSCQEELEFHSLLWHQKEVGQDQRHLKRKLASNKVRSGQVRSGQVRSGQVRSGQDNRSGQQVRSNWPSMIRSGKVDLS